jgi:GT2 family glycosyltransferase
VSGSPPAGVSTDAAHRALCAAFARYLERVLAGPGEARRGQPFPPRVALVAPGDDEVPEGCTIAVVLGEREQRWLDAQQARAGLTLQFRGTAVAGDGRRRGQREAAGGLACAVLDVFDRAALPPTPPEFDVLAVVTTYNEADIVGGLVDRLVGAGLRVHVVDNWSDDATPEIVAARAARLAPGRVVLERFPSEGPSPHFELERLLERVEAIAHGSGADWVVHHDADEIREPPWPGVSLRDALFAVESWGFDCVDHTVVNFVPVDDSFVPGADLAASFSWCELGDSPGHFLQQKAWKPGAAPVAMASTGGHEIVASTRRVFPYKFLTRHYPIRSQEHGERKILGERQRRFSPAERARGWHLHYDHLGPGSSFLGDPAELVSFAELADRLLVQRLSGVGLPGNPFPGESADAVAQAAAPAGPAPTRLLRIQTVLFDTPRAVLERYLRGVRQAAAVLTTARPEYAVELALGDCSAEPVLAADEVEQVRWSFTGTGTTAVYYEAFRENLGHGGAQQRLFAGRGAAEGVVVLNPDTCASPRLLLELLDGLAAGAGIVEARHLPLEHQKAYDPVTGATGWASGACSLVGAAVLDTVGGYDTDAFFLYCDDVDLSWRARLAGFGVVHRPTAVVFHDKRLSAHGAQVASEHERYHSGLASLLLYAKYSRPDLVAMGLDAFDASPDPVHPRAAAELRRRRDAGLLPEPIDPDGTVADFSSYAYAPLRFDYAR